MKHNTTQHNNNEDGYFKNAKAAVIIVFWWYYYYYYYSLVTYRLLFFEFSYFNFTIMQQFFYDFIDVLIHVVEVE